MTTSDDVQAAIVTALTGTTGAGANVFTPRTWPTDPVGFPDILIQSPRERKESKGKNAPSYDVFTTIRVVARAARKVMPNDAAAKLVLADLSVLQRQIEVAVINNYALYLIISEIASVDIVNDVKSDGNQAIGELTMDFVCVFYQGAEIFAVIPTVVLDRIDVAAPNFPGAGFTAYLGEYDRVTDSGDSRVTDDGIQRVTDQTPTLN